MAALDTLIDEGNLYDPGPIDEAFNDLVLSSLEKLYYGSVFNVVL